MPAFQTIEDLRLTGKITLVRADLNVPMKDGRVTDTTRLERFLPTLAALKNAGAKIVILSHFGRPKGTRDEKYSLRPVAAELENILGEKVCFAEDCIGLIAKNAVDKLQNGQILVLENTRFHKGEEANDPVFAQELAKLGDIFINDAFSAAHRAHASTTGLAALLPAAAGRLMQEELFALARAFEKPEKPLVALIGGSKISTKLDLLNNVIEKVDVLILGGGMANTFLAAKGVKIGKSLAEPDMLDTARKIAENAKKRGCEIILPKDFSASGDIKEGAKSIVFSADELPDDMMILDIGPASIKAIKDILEQCRTIVWNGPLGVFEKPPFDRGTNEIAICVSDLTKRGRVTSVAGGGDTVAALAHAGVTHGISYLSTAGGAFLEWLEGKTLPGVAALEAAVPPVKMGKAIL